MLLAPDDSFWDLPRRHFRTIVIDPPQRFKSFTALQSTNWDSRRDVEKHYPTCSIEDLCRLPVKDLAHPDGCHLWMWMTGPNLLRATELIVAYDFRYSAQGLTWAKLSRRFKQMPETFTERDFAVGLGLTTRHNPEICLLARRGNARRIAKDVRELIIAPVREHSRKPEEVYRRIERCAEGPYLELFARQQRPNWTVWGNEIDKFSNGDPA